MPSVLSAELQSCRTIKAGQESSALHSADPDGTTPIRSRSTGRLCARKSVPCVAGSFPTGISTGWNGNIAAGPVPTEAEGRQQMKQPLMIERNVERNGIRLDCVFEGTAFDAEREEVRALRLSGMECPQIAEQTGMPVEQVMDYCRELGLPEIGSCHLVPPDQMKERRCPVCGRIIGQSGRGAPRKYCSDECYAEYERRNYKREKAGRVAFCQNCGRPFTAICESRSQRMFCSRNCYFEFRYGMKEAKEHE